MLNEKEKKKYNIIMKVEKDQISRKEASLELKISLRQIDKLRHIYREYGECGFIHKNRGRISEKKIDKTIIEELKQLYLNEYYDYNFEAFYDELTENKKYKGKYAISYSTLYNTFLNDNIISPLAHKGTIKLYNKKIKKAIINKENISEEKIKLYETRQIANKRADTKSIT